MIACTRWLAGATSFLLLLGTAPPIRVAAAARAAGSAHPVVALTGAGSTFDAPFFRLAFGQYSLNNPVTVTYQAVGSGAGIQALIANSVDFAASDVPFNQFEMTLAAANGPVIELPIVLGGVAIIYNEPKLTGRAPLRLDGQTLAGIFLGQITRWNDPAIAALNPDTTLPADQIRPVHRADSSGTTYIFTDYLSAVSPAWAARMSKGKSVAWPVGFHGTGSAGVAAWVKGHEGGIGYVELKYALDTSLPYLAIKNAAGAYVSPSQDSIRAAAAQFPNADARHFSIVNAPGSASYPIVSYSWVIVRQRQRTAAVRDAMARLLTWLTTDAQTYADQLHYVPLPSGARREAAVGIASLLDPITGSMGTRI